MKKLYVSKKICILTIHFDFHLRYHAVRGGVDMLPFYIGHIFMGAQYVLVQKDYGWYPESAGVVFDEETENEG